MMLMGQLLQEEVAQHHFQTVLQYPMQLLTVNIIQEVAINAIQHMVQDPLALKILEGTVPEGGRIRVDAKDGKIIFE